MDDVPKCTRCRGPNRTRKKTCERCQKARSRAYLQRARRARAKTNDTRHEKEQ